MRNEKDHFSSLKCSQITQHSLKEKFGKHETLYNFMMLKHYNEEEVKTMAKSPEEAEKR